jgi:hypothetical protein
MGALLSSRRIQDRRVSVTQTETRPLQVAERTRTFSICPDDWSNKHYSNVITFLKEKYPAAHVSLHAEKSDASLNFERPLSFEEGDIHIVVVYDAGTERILGFYNGADPQA